MSVAQTLNELLDEILKQHEGVFLVEAKHNDQHHEFILDADNAIGIATISSITRSLNHFAEERMPDEVNYSIDVCSPGADSPLKMLRQFNKHIGRQFAITLADQSTFNGHLKAIDGDVLTFEYHKALKPKKNDSPELEAVPYQNIKKATIILSFK